MRRRGPPGRAALAGILNGGLRVQIRALIHRLTGRRPPSTAALCRQASRLRDAGRFEEALERVQQALALDPQSVVGHLLAGSLHAVFRDPERARASFEHVLRLDPTHPRALLGLARIALEEDDPRAAAELLRRALARYPDFPEAQALLAVVTADDSPRPRASAPALRADRLRVPAESREMLLATADGRLLLAQPRGPRSEEIAARTARVYRLAAAMVSRIGCGPLEHAVIEGAAETTVARSDGGVLLSLTFGRDVPLGQALVHLDRVWANSRAEMGTAVA